MRVCVCAHDAICLYVNIVFCGIQEIVDTEREEFLNEREEAEMEMSDSEDAEGSQSAKKKKITDPTECKWQSS